MTTPPTIDPEIIEEIDRYEAMVKKFRAGEITQDTFQRFRLQHGVYGQRQDNVQMIRIKIPLGMLTAEQIDCIAELAETIAHDNGHLTTRQDIQIHYVKLENTPMLMRKLAAVGLTTREACGNTVRNVTCSPGAGVDPDEVFDVTPYARGVAYHLLRNPINQNLPRKFKIAFDGGGRITALPMLHDLGVVAKIENGTRGWKVFVGGGLGSSPRIAKVLHEFLPVEELIPWTHAVLQVFDRHGERKIRSKARIKFLIDKWGFEKFKDEVTKERTSIRVDPAWNDYLKHLSDWEEKPPVVDDKKIPKASESAEFLAWKKTNVTPQKQKGYSMAEIRLTTGDMNPRQMRAFSDILRRYAGGKCRNFVHQNFLIRWVRDQDLPALYEELKKIGFAKTDPQTIYDVLACPGTDTCRLGISSSMGLARELERRLYAEDGKVSAVARDVVIKISGCPNSCGQHHIANIGLHGGAFPMDGKTMPAFMLFIGGNPGRDMVVAQLTTQIPSKNVPDAVIRLVSHYADNRKPGEAFNDFYGKLGKEGVINLLTQEPDLLKAHTFQERPDLYTDWEDKQEFALQKGVIGECAGAVVADVVPNVRDGEPLLQMAEAHLGHGQYDSAGHKAYEALAKMANGLLFHRLVQPFVDSESIHEFENHFVKTGILPQWRDFRENVEGLRKKPASESTAKEWIELGRTFLKDALAKEAEIVKASPRKGAAPQQNVPDNLFI
ncbi:MAG TPA: nitrite reductase [bacterium]|nr:nitrite reductase [bacterium]